MFKKIKDILGIEGVKVELTCPQEVNREADFLEGQLKLSSQSKKTVTGITIKLIEKYQRGRKEEALINEYLLSSLDIDVQLELEKDNIEDLTFKLPISLLLSEIDQFGSKNFITGGLASLAKKLKNVNSYYRIEAIVKVKESSLDAVAKQTIVLT